MLIKWLNEHCIIILYFHKYIFIHRSCDFASIRRKKLIACKPAVLRDFHCLFSNVRNCQCHCWLHLSIYTFPIYRFGGQEFPPMIFFKIFIHTEGKGVKYLSGKRVIKPASEVCMTVRSLSLFLSFSLSLSLLWSTCVGIYYTKINIRFHLHNALWLCYTCFIILFFTFILFIVKLIA